MKKSLVDGVVRFLAANYRHGRKRLAEIMAADSGDCLLYWKYRTAEWISAAPYGFGTNRLSRGNSLLFGRAKPALGSIQSLGVRIAADIPGFRAGSGVVGNDGATALVTDDADSTVFLVKAFGDRLVMRKLSRGVVRGVSANGLMLSLRLKDFTLPKARIALESEAAARDWEARLKRLAA